MVESLVQELCGFNEKPLEKGMATHSSILAWRIPWTEEPDWLEFRGSLSVRGFAYGSDGIASASNAGDPGSVPGSGRSPGEGNGNPLQYSCLENPTDGGAGSYYSPWGRKESDTTERLPFPFQRVRHD